jgi:hypothetical protein
MQRTISNNLDVLAEMGQPAAFEAGVAAAVGAAFTLARRRTLVVG